LCERCQDEAQQGLQPGEDEAQVVADCGATSRTVTEVFGRWRRTPASGPIRRGTEPCKSGSFHRLCVLGVIRTTGSRFQYDLRHPTIGKGAHAEQRGVSEQQCDKHDQGQEKPPVEILFGTQGGAAAQDRAEGNVRCLGRKISPSASQLAPTLGVDGSVPRSVSTRKVPKKTTEASSPFAATWNAAQIATPQRKGCRVIRKTPLTAPAFCAVASCRTVVGLGVSKPGTARRKAIAKIGIPRSRTPRPRS
jgi:hypothetical protein